MPRNVVRFLFGPHWSYGDAVATRPAFLWCSIYCPEGTGYGDGNRQMYRMLSDGVMNARMAFTLDARGGIFELAQFRLIEGSGKRVELIDVPHGSALLDPLSAMAEEVRLIPYFDAPFHAAAANAEDVVTAFVVLNRDRERHIVGELEQLDRSCADERILVRLGSVHYPVARLAQSVGLTVCWEIVRGNLGTLGLCYNCVNRGVRIPPHTLAQHMLAGLILRHCPRFVASFDDGEEEAALMRAVRPFGTAEIAELWDRLRGSGPSAREILRDALRRHGVWPTV